jgi:uncharacterized protein
VESLKFQARGPDLVIPVHVRPSAQRDEIIGIRGGVLAVSVSAPPVEGKANLACCRLLADVLKLPVSQIEVVSGGRARQKRIRLRNVDPTALKTRLAPFLQ